MEMPVSVWVTPKIVKGELQYEAYLIIGFLVSS